MIVRLTPATLLLTPLALGACSSSNDLENPSPVDSGFTDSGLSDGGRSDAGQAGGRDSGPLPSGCDRPYPAFASTMALNQAVEPWSWARAIDGQGVETDLNLTEAFCNADPDIDWSPFDLLLFVSIPAW